MPNKIGLFVDTSSNIFPIKPPYLETWVRCDNMENFKRFITEFFKKHGELPELISLNHDFTDKHISLELRRPPKMAIAYEMYDMDSGLHMCKFLTDFCIENKVFLNRITVHGINSDGKANMCNLINQYYKLCGQTDKSCFSINWEFSNGAH